MGNMMVPFEAPQLPAHIAQLEGVSGDDLTAGTGGGFPVISIKGKVFHINRGDQREMVTRPDGSGEPAASLEVVILRANPNLSKTYYASGYVEGSEDKPTCYSDNGIEPAADAQEPQAVKCAICPHNQWGSKITEQGSKAKACADVRRLAVAPVNLLNDPMLIRVPAASLKGLGQYGEMLKKRGVKYPSVVTKISFDFAQAFPALTFSPVAFVTPEMAKQIQEMMGSELVLKIVGMSGQNAAPQATPALPPAATTQPAPAPAPAPKAAAPAPKAASKKAAAPASPTASAFATAAPQPAPAPTVQKSKAIEVKTDDIESELAAVLAQAGFDDK